jgi:hypothetical protein
LANTGGRLDSFGMRRTLHRGKGRVYALDLVLNLAYLLLIA